MSPVRCSKDQELCRLIYIIYFFLYKYIIYICIYYTATGLTPGGSSTVHIYTQTLHRTQSTQTLHTITYQTLHTYV
jgi:hypothetical protein